MSIYHLAGPDLTLQPFYLLIFASLVSDASGVAACVCFDLASI
jgi:hypothetical protein